MRVRLGNLLLIMLLAILLSACAPSVQPAETAATTQEISQPTATEVATQATSPEPSLTPTLSATDTPLPTRTPTHTVTPAPTPSPPDLEEEITEQDFLALVMTESLLVMVEEIALQVQQGEIDGFDAWGQLLGILAISTALDEALEADPPPALRLAWLEAREAVALIRSAAISWFDGEIDSSEVPDALDPARESVARTMDLAGAVFAQKYGVTQAEWDARRDTMVQQLRQDLRGENTEQQD